MVIDGEIMNRNHAWKTVTHQRQGIGGAVYEHSAAQAHSKRESELGPEQSWKFLPVKGSRDSEAFSERREQGMDVATDAGILTGTDGPGVDCHPQFRRGYLSLERRSLT